MEQCACACTSFSRNSLHPYVQHEGKVPHTSRTEQTVVKHGQCHSYEALEKRQCHLELFNPPTTHTHSHTQTKYVRVCVTTNLLHPNSHWLDEK